jgi:hypothetical protein
MRTETTTTTQNIKLKKTQYFCEEEGCTFSTTDERAAKEHPWRKHKPVKKIRIELDPDDEMHTDTRVVFFGTEEAFKKYQERDYAERLYADPWEGPGWYEAWNDVVPCGQGCCTKTALFMRPATKTVETLRRVSQKIDETLKQLEQMDVGHDVG